MNPKSWPETRGWEPEARWTRSGAAAVNFAIVLQQQLDIPTMSPHQQRQPPCTRGRPRHAGLGHFARGFGATIELRQRHLTEAQMTPATPTAPSHTHTHARTQKPSACTYPQWRVSVRHGQRPEQPRAAEDGGGCGEPLAALLISSERLRLSSALSSQAGASRAATPSPIWCRDQITEELSIFRVGRFVIRLNQPRI